MKLRKEKEDKEGQRKMSPYVVSDLMALRTHHMHHIYCENEGLAGRAHDVNDSD